MPRCANATPAPVNMSRINVQEIGRRVCEAFKLPAAGITGVSFHFSAENPPVVMVERLLFNEEIEDFYSIMDEYQLVKIEPGDEDPEAHY
jgi:hypothetical protein